MVQLKPLGQTPKNTSQFCFNSTMVQLKRSEADIAVMEGLMFQFHDGSIKTLVVQ